MGFLCTAIRRTDRHGAAFCALPEQTLCPRAGVVYPPGGDGAAGELGRFVRDGLRVATHPPLVVDSTGDPVSSGTGYD